MEYHQITLSEWMEQKEQLRRELNNVREGFVRVGYILRRMNDTKAYEAEGYKSVSEFAEREHGLKPSTTSRWMAINEQFSLDGYSMQLDPKYINLNGSQLAEMLTLSTEDREMVRPEMQRETIRELKRLEKEVPAEENGLEKIVRLFLENDVVLWANIVGWMQFRPDERDSLIEQVNPSGNRSFRKNGMMLMMYKDYIKYKAAGQKPETVQWEEFFETVAKIGAPAAEEREDESDGSGNVRGDGNDGEERGREGGAVEEPDNLSGADRRHSKLDTDGLGNSIGNTGRDSSETPGGDAGGIPGQEEANNPGEPDGDGRKGKEGTAEKTAVRSEKTKDAEIRTVPNAKKNPADKAEDKKSEGGEVNGSRDGQRTDGGADDGDSDGAGGGGGEDPAERTEKDGAGGRGEYHEGSGDPGSGDHPVQEAAGHAGEGGESGERTENTQIRAEDAEKHINPPIAPAQIADESDRPDSEDDEEMTVYGKISQAKMLIRFAVRETERMIDLRKWADAKKAAQEIMDNLDFLIANDTANEWNS